MFFRSTKLWIAISLFLTVQNVLFGQVISKEESEQIDIILEEASSRNQPNSFLFKNASVLSMTDSDVFNADVLIKDGTIRQIGKNLVAPEAIVIDAAGKFLMPGLSDAHVHLFYNHPMRNTWMLLLVINGVTSVRDMAGTDEKLELREQIRSNQLLGPNLYQAGPILNVVGKQEGLAKVKNAEKACKEVIRQKKVGFDYIKVYNELPADVFDAIVDEASRQDLPVVGHVPDAVPLQNALNRQSTIEHLTGYYEWKDNVEAYLNVPDDYAGQTAASDTWNCLTFYNLMLNWSKEEVQNIIGNEAVANLLPSGLVQHWKNLLGQNVEHKEELMQKYAAHNKTIYTDIAQNLHEAGAKLMIGTDAGNLPLLIPGTSLHSELKALHDLGIPAEELLQMATIKNASGMGKEQEFGSIEVGKRADLLLLDKNPYEDLDNLQQKSGVMIRGIWLDSIELQMISKQIRAAFGND